MPECDAIVSNPPYSIKDDILKRLMDINKPFAMLMNVASLYDGKRRFTLLKNNPVDILYLYPRVKFFNDSTKSKQSSPTYQSAYVTKGILKDRVVLKEIKKVGI